MKVGVDLWKERDIARGTYLREVPTYILIEFVAHKYWFLRPSVLGIAMTMFVAV